MRRQAAVPFAETLRFAFAELRRQRLRSLLTGMSMTVAVAALIVVVTAALTGRDFVVSRIEGVGSNLIYAYYEAGGNVSPRGKPTTSTSPISTPCATGLGGLVEAAAGVMSTWDWVSVNGRPRQIRVLGSSAEYRVVRNLQVLAGRFLDAGDCFPAPRSAC